MGCGAETEANTLISSLTSDVAFNIPIVPLADDIFKIPGVADTAMYAGLTKLTNADLTTGTINGSGTYDTLMRGFKSHLKEEFDAGRITGAEYAKAYTTLTQNAMANGVQYLLGRDQAFWAAQLAQIQAINARVMLEASKVELVRVQLEALNVKANYALTKMKLSSESMNYCIAKYNLESILPAELAQKIQQTSNLVSEKTNIEQQTTNLVTENSIQQYNLDDMLPAQKDMVLKQTLGVEAETSLKAYELDELAPKKLEMLGAEIDLKVYDLDEMLPTQKANLIKQGELADAQIDLAVDQLLTSGVDRDIKDYTLTNMLPKQLTYLQEQIETQRSQTLDTRTDAAPVAGSVGKQKDLYSQQIVSYQRDAEIKASKPFTDAWIAMKTIDEGLLPPTGFGNATIDSVLSAIKTNNGL